LIWWTNARGAGKDRSWNDHTKAKIEGNPTPPAHTHTHITVGGGGVTTSKPIPLFQGVGFDLWVVLSNCEICQFEMLSQIQKFSLRGRTKYSRVAFVLVNSEICQFELLSCW
jgi:hypothetical protein